MEVFEDFQGAFYKKPLEARPPHAVPTYPDKIKNADFSAFFRAHYQSGLSAPNPDTRDFSGKVPWNLKSFAKMKWGV